VVLDPRAALPPDRVLFVDGIAPTLWLHDAGLPPSDPPPTCEPVAVPGLVAADGGVDLRATLAALRDRGLAVVFVEGGGVTVSRALAQGVLDRLHVAVAPLLIGRGRPGLQGPARASLAECRRPPARAHAMGADVLWDLDLRPAA
jgi:riboflavin biosynthesis pyrimidine reductase